MRRLYLLITIFALIFPTPFVFAKETTKTSVPTPTIKASATSLPEINSLSYIVIDRKSGKVITEKAADTTRRIASLTKMMTALVVLDKKVPLGRVQAINAAHKVGGSALNTKNGSRFTVQNLLYAVFLSSANDAANALVDATRLTRTKFISAMNAKAKAMGLSKTVFADPTGIDDRNISTAREMAKLAEATFKQTTIRRAMLTAKYTISIYGTKKKFTIKNSNGMLWKPEFDDVFVSGGKTGYLGPNGGWNLAVSFTDTKTKRNPELLIVILGTSTLKESEDNAVALADWAWKNFEWKK